MWYVLSAKHGLLKPDGPEIEPYDETLTDATVGRRREWTYRVAEQLAYADLLNEENVLVIHAGKNYYEQLLPIIESEVNDVCIPTEGLAIGETRAWYDAH